MEKEFIIQKFKSDPKGKATASFILGIISSSPMITFLLTLLLSYLVPGFMNHRSPFGVSPLVLEAGERASQFFPVSVAIGIAGMIFGKFGLRSTKKNLAIIGIIFSLFGLGSSIVWFLLFSRVIG